MKKEYFYYECDMVNGVCFIGIEVDAKTIGNKIHAERDLKQIILEPCENVILDRPRKPKAKEWFEYKKPWCIMGVKA